MPGVLEEAALMLHIPWLERKRLQTKQKGLASFPAHPPHSCLPLSYPTTSGNKQRWFRLHIPCASKNSSSELSSESLAMLCILHSEILWREGLAGKNRTALCDALHRQDGEFPTWSLLEEESCVLYENSLLQYQRTQNPDDAGVMSVYRFPDPACLLLEPASKMLH